jgi:hypothetical protein
MTDLHIRNAEKCPACCCGGRSVHEGCGGRWHESVVDEDREFGWIHNYRCDKCNLEDYHPAYKDYTIEFED